MLKRILSATASLALLLMLLIPAGAVFAENGDSAEWNPETFTEIDDCDNNGAVAVAINPPQYWFSWGFGADDGYWAPIFGGAWKGFTSYNGGADNQYIIYDCRPNSAVALTVLYNAGNKELGESRDVRVYTSPDLAEWTEVTGDNYQKKVDSEQFGDGSRYRVWFGAASVPEGHRYVKFDLPTIAPEQEDVQKYYIDSYRMQGGDEPADYTDASYYFCDDLNDLTKLFEASDHGWKPVANTTYPEDQQLRDELNDYRAEPGTLGGEKSYLAYRVKKGATVLFHLRQSDWSGKWIQPINGMDRDWLVNAAYPNTTMNFRLEISSNGTDWTEVPAKDVVDFTYPYWCGESFVEGKPTNWLGWLSRGLDRRILKTTLPGDAEYVRIVFPEAPKVSGKNNTTSDCSPWDLGLAKMEAFSYETADPSEVNPKTVGYGAGLMEIQTATKSIALKKTMTAEELLKFVAVDGGYTLQLAAADGSAVTGQMAVASGMRLLLLDGALELAAYTLDLSGAQGSAAEAMTNDPAWDPTLLDVVDDGDSDCKTAHAINPPQFWFSWGFDESDYWAGVFGGAWKGFTSYDVGLDNQYFMYTCKPGASVALCLLYRSGNASLGAARDVKIYTSPDKAEWTEITGDNYKKTIDDARVGNGSLYRAWFGVGAVPAGHTYVKFCLPRTETEDFDAQKYYVDSYLAKGGTQAPTHENDAYYFVDDLNEFGKEFAKSDSGWVTGADTEYPGPDGYEMRGELNDYRANPDTLGEGRFMAYHVAKNSTVIFHLLQNQYSGKWIQPSIAGMPEWLVNCGLFDDSWTFCLEKSKDGVTWEAIEDSAIFDSVDPYWNGEDWVDGVAQNYSGWKSRGLDRRTMKTTLSGDYTYIRVVWPEAPMGDVKGTPTAMSGYDLALTQVEAYSDTAYEEAAAPEIRVLDKAKELLLIDAEEEMLTLYKNMTAGQLKTLITYDSRFTLELLSRYADPLADDDTLRTGCMLNLKLGDMTMLSYIINAEEADGDYVEGETPAEPGEEEPDDEIPETGAALPLAAFGVAVLAGGALPVLRRRR